MIFMYFSFQTTIICMERKSPILQYKAILTTTKQYVLLWKKKSLSCYLQCSAKEKLFDVSQGGLQSSDKFKFFSRFIPNVPF